MDIIKSQRRLNLNREKSVVAFSIIFAFLIIVALLVYLFVPTSYKTGTVSAENWEATQEFTLDYTIQLQKDETKDFVVLNLADVQMNDYDLFNGNYEKAINLITKLITDKQPDLITLTGDNFWGPKNILVIQRFLRFLDGFNIPWAPVMGNHDNDGSGDYNWFADILLQTNNCIFKKGPQGMGCGNYVITIMENNTIVQAIIMMDSHDSEVFANQLEWYSWVVNGLNNIAGRIVPSTLMFHIPLVEYSDAWDYYVASGFDTNIGSGEKNETVCCSDTNNGFFTLIKSLGSTKNVICGHDHINDFSILFEGVRLTYAIKSSFSSYYDESILGGTIINISSTTASIEQYIPA